MIEKIRLHKKGYESVLSPQESAILGVLWNSREARVRDIYRILRKRNKIALTSVAVCLDRLYKKGMVMRQAETGPGGVHYIYSPLKSKADLDRSIVENIVDKIIYNFGESAVSYFNERFSKSRRAKRRGI
ncbi:MAG: BlaI/MecI/CopY family transcriptional regulator [Candidatus Aenigmarchaeota archaeon]|nr:BlaI/MecI/CopY family transcriptional regulator [Candidatus Aenigmarchaeota archaeon]